MKQNAIEEIKQSALTNNGNIKDIKMPLLMKMLIFIENSAQVLKVETLCTWCFTLVYNRISWIQQSCMCRWKHYEIRLLNN